jgi:hypothetical protein
MTAALTSACIASADGDPPTVATSSCDTPIAAKNSQHKLATSGLP